ncbi:UNVERIFIED_CONTAM: hypothetical protein FKN15_051392 [Acipenser sinensis]
MAEEDALSIEASWGESSFPTEMEEGGEPELSAEAEPSPLDNSGRAMPVRVPDAGRGSLPALLPSFPRFHGGSALLLGVSGLGRQRAY